MFDPLDFEKRRIVERLNRVRGLTIAIMSIERACAAFWMPVAWCVFFVSLWLFEVGIITGKAGAVILAVLFFLGLGYLVYRGLGLFSLPRKEEVLERIERHNALPHRPLRQMGDRLATPASPLGQNLWAARKEGLADILRALRFPKGQPVLPGRDPYAFRIAVGVIFIAALIIAGQGWERKIAGGLFPLSPALLAKADNGASITIIPPEYTRAQTTTIKGHGQEDKPLIIPEGSAVKAQARAGLGTPMLIMGEDKIPMAQLDDKSYGIEATAREGKTISIRQFFFDRVRWEYSFVPDQPPSISSTAEPEVTEFSALRFSLSMKDDYGVQTLAMRMTLDPVVLDAPLGDPHEESRVAVSPPGEEISLNPVYDLSAHVWAGLPVLFTFEAVDGAKKAASTSISVQLPERSFSHPVARKLIAHRKALVWDYSADRQEIIDSLYSLLSQPESYGYDLVVLLALRTAAARLEYSQGEATAKALINLFWNTAIHLEDGDLTLARQNLMDAQRALENALGNPATTPEEMAARVEDLRQALADYFRELGREMQKQMAEGASPMLNPDMLNQLINPEALAQFFDQLQSEALSGDPSKAAEMLSQLNRFLDMMDPSLMTGMPQDMQMMVEGVNELQELIRRQEELLDQTRLQADQSGEAYQYSDLLPDDPESEIDLGDLPPPPQRTPQTTRKPGTRVDTALNKIEQEALRYVLGQLMLEADSALGEIPENMGLAEREMRSSSTYLGDNAPALSLPHQEKAIEYLREAMEQLSQQMMARMKEMTGIMLGQGMGQTDPLGRPMGSKEGGQSWYGGSEVKIPEEAERKKVEEILKLLRKRSGEFERPEEELDYFRRLLRQF